VKVLPCACVAAFVVLAALPSHHQTEIGSSDGLAMSIAADDTASGPSKSMRFKLIFRNLKKEGLTLIPGTLVSCGMTPSKTSSVKLNLTDQHGKQHRHLPYLGDGPPYQGFCAGQIEFYVVDLHPGESVTLPLDIGKYVDLSDSKQHDAARFPAGNYVLQVELTIEPSELFSYLKNKTIWTGKITSNTVPVHFASEFMAPMDDYPR